MMAAPDNHHHCNISQQDELETESARQMLLQFLFPDDTNDTDLISVATIKSSLSGQAAVVWAAFQQRLEQQQIKTTTPADIQSAFKYNYQTEEQQQQDQPKYVNAKQYRRILIRRKVRNAFEQHQRAMRCRNGTNNKTTITTKSRYRHESRHIHATSRGREKNGRFAKKQKKVTKPD